MRPGPGLPGADPAAPEHRACGMPSAVLHTLPHHLEKTNFIFPSGAGLQFREVFGALSTATVPLLTLLQSLKGLSAHGGHIYTIQAPCSQEGELEPAGC